MRTGTGGTSANLFFGERGSEEFKGFAVVDLSVNYAIPVWGNLEPWIQLQTFNVFNNQKLIQWNTSITPDPNSPLDANAASQTRGRARVFVISRLVPSAAPVRSPPSAVRPPPLAVSPRERRRHRS